MASSKSLKANFVWQASYQVLLIVIPLVTTPYLSRVLGPEGVGAFSFTQAVSSYFVMFAMLGMSTYGVREIAAAGDDRGLRSRTFWSAYMLQAMIGIAMCLAYAAYLALFDSVGGVVVGLVWALYVVSAPLDVTWLLFGCEEFKVPTIRSIVTKLATLVVIFGFVRGPEDLWIYCAAIAGSLLANQILLWPFVRRYVDFVRPTLAEIGKHFRPNLVLFIPVVAISLYTSMDKILLGGISGMQQAGFFEYSEKLSKMPMAVITALGTVMLPRMTAELSAGKREGALGLLGESIWAMEAMAMALAFGIAAIAPEFALVFLGEEFAECDSVMMVLAIVIPVISATNVIGRQYLVPIGRDSRYTMSVCCGAIINVTVNLLLIPLLGAMGAAIATVAAELTVLIVQAWSVRSELPLTEYAFSALPFVVCGVLMFACVRIAALMMNGAWGMTPLGLGLEIIAGAFVFIILALVWCVVSKNAHFRRILKRG